MADHAINITQVIEEIDCEWNIVVDPKSNTNRRRKRKFEDTDINKIFDEELPLKRCKTHVRLEDEEIIDDIIQDKEYKDVLVNIAKLYREKDVHVTQKFNRTLLLLSKYQDSKEKDLQFRKSAKQFMLSNFEDSDRYIDDWRIYKSMFKEPDIQTLMDDLIINIRNHRYTLRYSDDYKSEHSQYIEIGMKSNKPHKEYTKVINKLFENIFVNNISSIICEYSRNSYRWYSIDVEYGYSNTDYNYYEFWMYNVPFSFYDHYDGKYTNKRALGYRQEPNKRAQSADRVTLAQLINDLDIKEFNEMSRLQISYFITAVGNAVLDLENDDTHALAKKFNGYHDR